jgi:hypothetical protein
VDISTGHHDMNDAMTPASDENMKLQRGFNHFLIAGTQVAIFFTGPWKDAMDTLASVIGIIKRTYMSTPLSVSFWFLIVCRPSWIPTFAPSGAFS